MNVKRQVTKTLSEVLACMEVIETTFEALRFVTCRLLHVSGRLLIERLQPTHALAKLQATPHK